MLERVFSYFRTELGSWVAMQTQVRVFVDEDVGAVLHLAGCPIHRGLIAMSGV